MSSSRWVNALIAGVVLAPVAIIAIHSAYGAPAETATMLTPEALKEIAQVEAEIDRIEAQTLQRPPLGQPGGRAGAGAADQPCRDGPARYCLCRLSRLAAAVSCAVRGGLGPAGVRDRVARRR